MPKKRNFLSFELCRQFAISLNLKSKTEWAHWTKSGNRPDNIPVFPNTTYAKTGWTGWGDFLGTGKTANQKKSYKSFEDARAFARSLGFKSVNEWKQFVKSNQKPSDIPATPYQVYAKKGWINYSDFLGADIVASQHRTYRSFEDARVYARKLNFKKITEWKKWAAGKLRPIDIPKQPHHAYKDTGWINYADFLGADIVAPQHRTYRSFEKARVYARKLNFKKVTEWKKWADCELHPIDIPKQPHHVYKDTGWIDYGDFLGADIVANQNRKYRSFSEARLFAQTLKLKGGIGWRKWSKTADKPSDIPSNPSNVYKEKWKGWGDFLGTGVIATQNRIFLSFKDARTFVRSLKLKSQTEWRAWAKSTNRPKNLPAYPDESYAKKGWISWGDFLGNDRVGPKNYVYRSFEEAQDYVRSLGLNGKEEWEIWRQLKDRPKDIPSMPYRTYAKKGWISWGDFFGTGYIAHKNRKYRSFEDARTFVQSIKLLGKNEWFDWIKSHKLPKDIPNCPDHIYAKKGWIGWGDWLGVINSWNVNNIRGFVSSLLPYLGTLSPAGLHVLLQQNGLLEMARNSKGYSFIQALHTGRFPKEELEKFINEQPSLVNDFLTDAKATLEECQDDLQAPENILSENETINLEEELPTVETKDILATLDSELFSSLDREAIDFFIKEAVARIWQHAFSDESKAIQQLEQYSGDGDYPKEVKGLFLRDYRGAKDLIIPSGYSFPHQPLLMQRYTAHLVKSRKRLGNWSGTGAGKTLSAVLASRVIGANLTVICCPNNVIDTWDRNIKEIYPDSTIMIKKANLKEVSNGGKNQYLILNYEFFQQPGAGSKLQTLLKECSIDFVIIDEIHFSKQREVEKMSERKRMVGSLLSWASDKNENLHVLGMSATPVINNLFEGKTLIELVTGVHHDDLQTKPTVPNCISHYQRFVSYGIRWLPQYQYKMNLVIEDIDCSSFLSEIKHHSAFRSMVDLEAVLTKAKLPFILKNLRSKTIVYTYYLKGIDSVLQDAIAKAGWRVALFTGETKDGLEQFIGGDADVLIASSCIGTGVDGLQHVCNRLIINTLPWTHAEFEQLKGRIYRQGQKFDHVDILVPLTFADVNKEKWSWCESRWKRIQFKKSIADAAVDGVIPEGLLRTPAQAYKDTMDWLERLERGEVYEVERKKISIPLSDEITVEVRRRFGDLTQMNYRINHEPSKTTHDRFHKDPTEWEHYHASYREDRKSWPVTPYQEAIKWFKARPHMIIGDFGCGEALLAAELENTVHSFDHVAINKKVTPCDMTHVPLDDECLDAAVFSLSLMGTNFVDYLKEAHRCLKLDGHLWIAEPTSRIKDINAFKDLLFRLGFDINRVEEKWKFTFIRALKSEREINLNVLETLKNKNILY